MDAKGKQAGRDQMQKTFREVIDELCAIYDESVAKLRSALARYPEERRAARSRGAGGRPVRLSRAPHRLSPGHPAELPARAFGRLNQPGRYAISIARPYLFRKYLTEQLSYLIEDYDVEVSVGRSASEIPYPYVLDGTDDLRLDGAQAADLALWFPTTELAHIGDEIADGEWVQSPGDGAAAVAVRRAARRFQPGPAAPLYRHAGRAYPALPAVHQLCPLRRRVRPLGGRGAGTRRTAPMRRCRRPGGVYRHQGHARRGRAGRRGRLAPAPDAGLPPDRAARRGHQPGQYRRRPVQRQDDLRPSRGAAARSRG